MKKLATFAASIALSSAAIAGPIKGTIAFVGTFTDNVDAAGNGTLDFANVIQWSAARTDDFLTVMQGDFFGVGFGPINVTGGAIDLPVNPMWSLVDGDGDITSFVLDTVDSYTNDASGVAVDGSGWLNLSGFDATRGVFSLDTANQKLTFDADAVAVASPATAALLGMGLIALGLQRATRRK